jgi:hypothetical protein
VNPAGFASLRGRGSWTFTFRSPSREARAHVELDVPEGKPVPEPKITCRFEYWVHSSGRGRYMQDTKEYLARDGCGESLAPPPRCTIAQAWSRAIGLGAPSSALAEMTLEMAAGAPLWAFKVTDRRFRVTFPDDCQ